MAATLAWCAAVGWFTLVRQTRVPLVGLADLGFHELGHLIGYLLPVGDLVTAAAGSGLQVLVPLAATAWFAIGRRDPIGVAAGLAWTAANLADVAVYVADAPHERLELIGGEHDWAYVLGPEQLDHLDWAAGLASALRFGGAVLLVVAVGIAVDAGLRRAPRRGIVDPADVATRPSPAPAPDDLLPRAPAEHPSDVVAGPADTAGFPGHAWRPARDGGR